MRSLTRGAMKPDISSAAAVLQRPSSNVLGRYACANAGRCRIGGLSDSHGNNRHTLGLQPVCLGQDIHRVERLDIATA